MEEELRVAAYVPIHAHGFLPDQSFLVFARLTKCATVHRLDLP